jgi:hypothetical protein
MIKTHDNSVFDDVVNPWIPLPKTEEGWLQRFRELDRLGKYIISYKEPVDGELWLDKELDEFITKSGKRFSPQDLKQFSKYGSNIVGYSFTEELTKRREYNRIRLQQLQAEALIDANDRKKYQEAQEGKSSDEQKRIFLTKEEIKAIKEEVKSTYKEDLTKQVTKEDCDEIQDMLQTILTYLEKGENFEGEQETVYQKAKALIAELRNGPYKPLNEVRDDMHHMLVQMDSAFPDGWGIRESYRKSLDSTFSKYVSRFRDKIEKDELELFQQITGVDLYAPTDEFYEALGKSKIFHDVDLSKYIGKNIPHPREKYKDVLFNKYENGYLYFTDTSATTKRKSNFDIVDEGDSGFEGQDQSLYVSEETLKSLVAQREIGSELEIPLKLRFTKLYNKDIRGNFNRGDLTLLRTFEKLIHYLPEGHVLTNSMFNTLRKETYFDNSDNSYAHYQGGSKKEIYISNQAAKSNQLGIVDLHSGDELASVLIHEIGHAVSEKLRGRKSLNYRKFVYECGWSWEQFQLGNRDTNYKATGEGEETKRIGSKSSVPLITQYSGRSPEEAFAEYYSFYSQYKKPIDRFLETGKKTHLEKETMFHMEHTPQTFGEHITEFKRTNKGI